MTIEEKETIYEATHWLEVLQSKVSLVSSNLTNPNGALNKETLYLITEDFDMHIATIIHELTLLL